MILMLPNTSGAWAGTGVLDSKVAGGVSLLCFLLFNIYSCTDDTDVSSLFCCNSFSGFISSANFNFQILALKILK